MRDFKKIRSCWAFAGGAAIDGAFKIQKNIVTAQSQQELGEVINDYKSKLNFNFLTYFTTKS